MEEYTLVVMAAGLNNNFKKSKHMIPVGPNDEYIIDYSIYDAIKAGFNKIIFVINQKDEDEFKKNISSKIEDKIKVEYVYQDINYLPEGYIKPKERTIPWGSGHAIYCASPFIKGPFAVINSDNLYGYESFEILIDFLKNNQTRNHYLCVCYKTKNTISLNGEVTRAIVESKMGIVENIIESKVSFINGHIVAKSLNGEKILKIDDETLTSVNLFGFTPNFIKTIQNNLPSFLDSNINNLNVEYLLPNIVEKDIREEGSTVYVKLSPAKWYGITYEDDISIIKEAINNYILEGKYPKKLWE